MKVLLIQPPIEDFYDTSIRTYPLGLLYLAAKISDIADVVVLDARSGKRQTLNEHEFPELETFYRTDVVTPFSLFGRYSRYGMGRGELRKAIEREQPDVVGISSMCSAYGRQATEAADVVKKIDRYIVTVIGGVHPTLFPEHILADTNVDYCVRGEGETPFRDLVSALTCGRLNDIGALEGVCFREDGRIHLSRPAVSTDIDLLPDRSRISADRYRISKKPYTFFLTSRGCPNACGFCGKPPVPYRRRSLKGIEEEIGQCLDLGIEAIDFEDDMLNFDRRTFSGVLEILTGRGLTLSAMNGIYPGAVDIPTLEAMHQAGFHRLNFSLVDSSPRVLDGQNRHQHQSFLALLPYLEDAHFLLEVHFIIGLPGQSISDVVQTLAFLMEKRLLLGPSMFYLAPGSRIHSDLIETGESNYDFPHMRSSVMAPVNPMFPRSVTYALMKLVRFINYTKGFIDRHEGATRLSELIDVPDRVLEGPSRSVLQHLLLEKRLTWFDTTLQSLMDEPADQDLVASFFAAVRHRRIKGYRTNRSVTIDI
jgi:hypothetical protein